MKTCPFCGSNNIVIFDSDSDMCNTCAKWFPVVEAFKPLSGSWRYNNGYVCCGSMRIFRIDIDTNPSEEYINNLMNWVCKTLNK
jgi:hypothetical protein